MKNKHTIKAMSAAISWSIAVIILCLDLRAETVTVFAAASLTESVKEIAGNYEKQSVDKIVFNFAASGPLARQIEEGAPADIFFSADEAKMDEIERKGLIVKETRRSRLSNQLVIVAAAGSSLVLAIPRDLASESVKRIALGDIKMVPAGTYSKEYLSKQELWGELEKKVVSCESVRSVLAFVESGNVDAGIVYKTDAAISKKVKVAYEVPLNQGPRISYPLALVKDSRQPVAARKFLEHLAGPVAGEVFARRGFILLPVEGKK